MPRYYFHVRRGQVTILDIRGIELVDDAEAAEEAMRRAVQIEGREATEILQSNGAILVDDEFSTVLKVPLASSGRNWFPSV